MDRQAHWQTVYRTKGDTDLSWFQVQPTVSLSLIQTLEPMPRRLIDVGGGHSALAGELLTLGVGEITVLDISAAAIDRGKERLGPLADRVRWIVADILHAPDLGTFDLWHDRAVFHFLTDEEDRRRYVAAAAAAVPPGGHAILATFALTGPEQCSGLPVCRYDAAQLASEFSSSFQMLRSTTEAHMTPWGTAQDFTYIVLARNKRSEDRRRRAGQAHSGVARGPRRTSITTP